MARSVKDAAYLLAAIAGKSPYDNYTDAIPFDAIPDYVAACNFSALSGKRIGIPRNVIDLSSDKTTAPIVTAFNAALDVLRRAGAVVVDNANFTGFEALNKGNYSNIVLEADFVSDLPKYLSELSYNPYQVYNLEDVLNFTHNFPLEDWPERDTLIWESALELGFDNTSPEFWSNYTMNTYLAGPLG